MWKKTLISLLVLFSLVFLVWSSKGLEKLDDELVKQNYRGKSGKNQNTLVARIFGMKKVSSSLIWVRQVVEIGELLGEKDKGKAADRIKGNSEEISYLDPYFESNYYLSGSVLAFIKSYNRYDYAMDIFKRGLEYNPDSLAIKRYIAGVGAASKGDVEEILRVFEGIIEENRDDLLINTVAFIYEKKYESTGDPAFLEEAIRYWAMLLDSKEEHYREKAKEKLGKYTNFKLD